MSVNVNVTWQCVLDVLHNGVLVSVTVFSGGSASVPDVCYRTMVCYGTMAGVKCL